MNLRNQYRTTLAISADFIHQELHVPCDKAIAKPEKLVDTGFTVSLRWPYDQLRTVPLFEAVQAFLDMLEQAVVAFHRQGLQCLSILFGAS